MLRKMLVIFIMACFIATPVFAKGKGSGNSEAQQKSAGQRIADHTADSVADVLTGEDSSQEAVSKTKAKSKSKGVPPGHAKKGTTPHGWTQGEKKGWGEKSEDSGTKSESPIKQMVKKFFGKEDK
jgi:hypothetical protein